LITPLNVKITDRDFINVMAKIRNFGYGEDISIKKEVRSMEFGVIKARKCQI
jgi:hypothetical protein